MYLTRIILGRISLGIKIPSFISYVHVHQRKVTVQTACHIEHAIVIGGFGTVTCIDIGKQEGTLIVVIDIGLILELCLVSSVSVLKRQPIVSSAKSKELTGSVNG